MNLVLAFQTVDIRGLAAEMAKGSHSKRAVPARRWSHCCRICILISAKKPTEWHRLRDVIYVAHVT